MVGGETTVIHYEKPLFPREHTSVKVTCRTNRFSSPRPRVANPWSRPFSCALVCSSRPTAPEHKEKLLVICAFKVDRSGARSGDCSSRYGTVARYGRITGFLTEDDDNNYLFTYTRLCEQKPYGQENKSFKTGKLRRRLVGSIALALVV